jgi:WD40 repeat protein
MIPVSSTKEAKPVAVAGAAAALVAGSAAVLLGGRLASVQPLTTEPLFIGLGLAVAGVLGARLAGPAVRLHPPAAIALALSYGMLVPALVAMFIVLPALLVAPIAIGFSVIAWSLTIPAAVGWLALVRLPRARDRLAQGPTATLVVALSAGLLVLRFTQPGMLTSAGGSACLMFPGERIGAIAWSPDGAWLAVGSENGDGGVVRLIEDGTGQIVEVARGPHVEAASAGVAVAPDGTVTYLLAAQGASVRPEDEEWSLWIASPGSPARRLVELPAPAFADLTWTEDGIAAVLWVDPATWTEKHRLVRVMPDGTLESLDEATLLEHPVLAPLVSDQPGRDLSITTPRGERTVPWPKDASDNVSVSRDGVYLVYHARALTPDSEDELYSHIVAQSTETGATVVLVDDEGWEPQVAGGKLAYLTFPAGTGNGLCVRDALLSGVAGSG